MDALLADLRFALRGLRRAPGFTLVAVLTLSLGIGATTAIFSVVHGVLLRPLGWADEARLVSVRSDYVGLVSIGGGLSVSEVEDLRAAPMFESAGAVNTNETAVLQGDRAERISAPSATSGFFAAVGVHPLYGRLWTAEEDLRGKDTVALVTYAAWRKRYAADPGVVGRDVTLNSRAYRIVGVLPESFSYGGAHEFFIPYGFTPDQLLGQRGAHYLEGVAKLRPGLTLQSASRLLDELSARLNAAYPKEYPPETGFRLSMVPLRDRFVSNAREPLLLLLGAVLLVLLIACANVANLLLARAAGRQTELAVRAAMGAPRGRIVRQLLTESALLALLGAAGGLLLAEWSLAALLAAAPRPVRSLASVSVDRPVLAAAVGLSVLSTLLFGLLPALRASRTELASMLKDGARATAPGGRLRSLLVVGQVALSLTLLSSAGLVLRSFGRVLRTLPGFDPAGLLAVRLAPGSAAYEDDNVRRKYFDGALAALGAIPGVQLAGGIDLLPMSGGGFVLDYFIEGYQQAAGEPQPSDSIRRALPGYFRTLRQPVSAGREFTDADDSRAAPVAVVNEAWVRRYFPGKDVLGRRLRLDSKKHGEWRTIVGVVGDVRDRGLDQPALPVYYFPARQHPPGQMTLVLRSSAPGALIAPVTAELARVDAAQPADGIALVEKSIELSLSPRRFPLQLLEVFAALALLLSAVGIYGVTSYAVAQRTREIGVRMAVGATAADVLQLVFGRALRLALAGVALGTLSALAAARLLGSQLYGIGPGDPPTYLAVAALLGAVAILASAIPALRAARVDPISALRSE